MIPHRNATLAHVPAYASARERELVASRREVMRTDESKASSVTCHGTSHTTRHDRGG